jgi:alkylation response protein AidB-like acyl-CoA dehydrogenase
MQLTPEQLLLKSREAELSNGLVRDRAAEIDQTREYPWDVVKALNPDGSAFADPALAAQAKIFASEAAIKIVNDALQVFGARGYSRDFPLERMARDVRMFTIGGGTAQVLRTLVASEVLGWKLPQTRDGYSRTSTDRT